jgi:4-alpha-glucanotransferase
MKRAQRRGGVLLHPTSLPGGHGIGGLGASARAFVDWLEAAGQRLWQVLPLSPVSYGNSPYTATSAFAGSALLIDLEALREAGWLEGDPGSDAPPDGARVDFDAVAAHRARWLAAAFVGFEARASAQERASLAAFCAREAAWLEDFVCFEVLVGLHDGALWTSWPRALRERDPAALAALAREHAPALARARFLQWVFDEQWSSLRAYARQRGVEVVGDIPIFVSLQSADVWARPALFCLGEGGAPEVVAGVPPDYFSAQGQRWGNPLYRWDAMAAQGYQWWIERFARSARLFDAVRVDHFRGFAAYWEIPASEETAINGRWVPGPGRALFDAVRAALGERLIIAEDLGDITPDVEALRDELGLPGMKILQFAFGGDGGNTHLPHQHPFQSVVYTGTHDNDTTVGWYWSSPQHVRDHLWQYARISGEGVAWGLIAEAWRSCADWALVPAQDVLELGGDCRMNVPGEAEGNWGWRLLEGQLHDEHAARLRELTWLYGRARVVEEEAPAR